MHHYTALVCFPGYLLQKLTDNIPQLPGHPFPFTLLVSLGRRSARLLEWFCWFGPTVNCPANTTKAETMQIQRMLWPKFYSIENGKYLISN